MTQNDMSGGAFRKTGLGNCQGTAKANKRNHHKGTEDTKNASSYPCDSFLCTICLGGEILGCILAALGPDFLAAPFSSSKEFTMQSRRRQSTKRRPSAISPISHYQSYLFIFEAVTKVEVEMCKRHSARALKLSPVRAWF
jgi:hypothetical protein